jgi:two-component system OmpR family response regulator
MHVTDSPTRNTSNTAEGIMGTGSVTPRRILVIDDEPGIRETLVHLLRALGYEVVEADGGPAGLTRLAEGAFDLVLTDLGMPGMNGWEVARAVKAWAPSAPVVLVTGWGDDGPAPGADHSLVAAVLSKPFRVQDIVKVLAHALGAPTEPGGGEAARCPNPAPAAVA